MSLRTARALIATGVILFGTSVVCLAAVHAAAYLSRVSAP